MISLLRQANTKALNRRFVCFDQKFANELLTRFDPAHTELVSANGSRVRSSWQVDRLHSGATVSVPLSDGRINNFSILCRSSNYSVIVRDDLSGQILTVKASNLPVLSMTQQVEKNDKKKAVDTILSLFDVNKVASIQIRRPFKVRGPMIYHANNDTVFQDSVHPYHHSIQGFFELSCICVHF